MDLEHAAQAHTEWKIKLRKAIATHEQLDVATVSADDRCPLGQWLHGEARAKYGKLDAYTACVAKHAAFHRETGKIAQVINAKNFTQAEKMLEGNTPYSSASFAAVTAIGLLRREAGL